MQSSTTRSAQQARRLSEKEVIERLEKCGGKAEIIEELYLFGATLKDDAIDRVKAVEGKAVTFAVYGTAVVTLLVSSAPLWSKVGNQWTPWISVCAGFCGATSVSFALRALRLTKFELISEDEWLKAECFDEVLRLKQYRILTLWGTIHSHGIQQAQKAREIERAQACLSGAVVFLFLLLLHIAFLVYLQNYVWIPFWKRRIQGHIGIPGWQSCGGLACALILASTLAFFCWRTVRVRLV